MRLQSGSGLGPYRTFRLSPAVGRLQQPCGFMQSESSLRTKLPKKIHGPYGSLQASHDCHLGRTTKLFQTSVPFVFLACLKRKPASYQTIPKGQVDATGPSGIP